MRRRTFLAALAVCLGLHAQAPSQPRPKLVLVVVSDQFRYDYLTRFGPEFTGGLKRLWEQGAVFTNAHYEAVPTMTAVGHSTILTGAMPAVSGILGNEWWDRDEGRRVESITDSQSRLVGGAGEGASPRRLLVSTIGDELKISGQGGKVFGVSLKDRSAILPAGRMADAAFWFDDRAAAFVTSDYYTAALPAWAAEFNAARPADQFAGKPWMDRTLPAPGPPLYRAIDASPYGDDLVHQFALRLLAAEALGTGDKTDVLSVSYSSVDYVGHSRGPDSPEIREMVLHVDRLIGELIAAAERQAGPDRLVVVFTADHGVAPVPEENIARKMPGGRVNVQAERAAVQQALVARFGEGEYIAAAGEMGYYFHPPAAGIDRAEMERVAAAALAAQPHVARVYTRSELAKGNGAGDRIDQRVRNGFFAPRAPDVIVLHEPYWLAGRGTNHGTPYSYDTHVPVVFLGPPAWIQPGHYSGEAAVHDIAPTLAHILGVAQPSGAMGRVLAEMLR
jgi:arylsulfatase A-like enzyme